MESHVLRYWEEELHLPIKRNELGHRYYTEEDVERFKQIKSMKERGLQLKAIKMILRDGRLSMLPVEPAMKPAADMTDNVAENAAKKHGEGEERSEEEHTMAINIIDSRKVKLPESADSKELVCQSREEKAQRLQWLLKQLIRETLQENNKDLCREMKESVVKELDYQFRAQEEREEERDRKLQERGEEYYQKMDELLRKKSSYGTGKTFAAKKKADSKKCDSFRQSWALGKEKKPTAGEGAGAEQKKVTSIMDKKKRHFLF